MGLANTGLASNGQGGGGSGGSGTSTAVTGPGASPGGNLGATPTVPAPTNFGIYWGVANVNTTITIASPTAAGQSFTLIVDEPVAGGSTINTALTPLAGPVDWPNGKVTWQTGASVRNGVDLFSVDGIRWQAFPVTGPTLLQSVLSSPTPPPGRIARFNATGAVVDSTAPNLSALWMPSGMSALLENITRTQITTASNAIISARLTVYGGVVVPAGMPINHVTYWAGTGAGYEVDSIVATGATSGVFNAGFTWNGNAYTTVTTINWNDTAAQVQTKLLAAQRTGAIAFSTDAPNGVVCTGGPLPGTAVVVTFANNANGPVTVQTISGSTLVGGTATFTRTTNGVLPSNQWAALVDTANNVLVKSTDKTTAPWGANNPQTFDFAAPYTPTVDTAIYAGVVVVCTGTMPTLQGNATMVNSAVQLAAAAPMMCGNSNTGLSNPASLGATINAPAFSNNLAYAVLS